MLGLAFSPNGNVQEIEEIYGYTHSPSSPSKKKRVKSPDAEELKKKNKEIEQLSQDLQLSTKQIDSLKKKHDEELKKTESMYKKKASEIEIENTKRIREVEANVESIRTELENEQLSAQQMKLSNESLQKERMETISYSRQLEQEKKQLEKERLDLRKRIDDLKFENSNVNNSIEEEKSKRKKADESYEENIKSLQLQIAEQTTAIETQNAEYNKAMAEISTLRNTKTDLQEKLIKLQAEVKTLLREREKLLDDTKTAESKQVSLLQIELEAQKKLVQSANQKQDDAQEAMQSLMRVCEELKSDLKQEQISHKQELNELSQSHRDQMRELQAKADKQLHDVQHKHDEDIQKLKFKFSELEKERERLHEEELRTHASHDEKNTQRIRELESRIAQENQSKLTLQKELTELVCSVKVKTSEIEDLQSRIKGLEAVLVEKNQDFEQKLLTQRERSKSFKERMTSSQQLLLTEFESRNAELKSKLDALEKESEQKQSKLEQDLKDTEQSLYELKHQHEQELLDSRKREEELSRTVREKDHEIVLSREQQAALSKRLELEQQAKLSDQQEYEESLQKFREQSEAKIREYESSIEHHRTRYDTLMGEYEKYRKEHETRTSLGMQSAEKEKQAREHLIQQYQQLYEEKKKENQELTSARASERDSLTSKIQELERSLESGKKEANEREIVLSSLKKEIDELRTDRRAAEDAKQKLEKCLEEMNISAATRDKELKELHQNIDKLNKQNADLSEQLAKTVDEIRVHKLECTHQISEQHLQIVEKTQSVEELEKEVTFLRSLLEERKKLSEEERIEKEAALAKLEEHIRGERERIDAEVQRALQEEEQRRIDLSSPVSSPRSPTEDTEVVVLGIEKELGPNLSQEAKEDIKQMKEKLSELRKSAKKISTNQIQEMQNYKSPPEVTFKSVRAVGLILDFPSTTLRTWEGCRRVLKENFKKHVTAYDPTTIQEPKKFREAKKELEGLDYEICCLKGSKPTGIMYNFVTLTIQLQHKATQLRNMSKQQQQQLQDTYQEGAATMLRST
jgi:chromosome segregation ATPase